MTKNVKKVLIDTGIPVILGLLEDEEGDLTGVYLDNEAAAYDMVNYLIGNGHENIGIINVDPETAYFGLKRELGYLRALKDSRLPFNKEGRISEIYGAGRIRRHDKAAFGEKGSERRVLYK
jgi:LacI family transcriptional regulator